MDGRLIHSPNFPNHWTIPPPKTVKINVDAAIRWKASAFGLVTRDHEGKHVFSVGMLFRSTSLIVEEATAILEGIRLLISNGPRLLMKVTALT